MSESSSDEPHSSRYISVQKAVQLMPKPFSGNPLELREFIQNVEATCEVVELSNYSLLFKFVCAKIGGGVKRKLLSRTHLYTWKQGFFYHCPKYHMKILLGDFNEKVGREIIFKPTTGQESLHQDSNDNGVRLVNFAT